MRENMRNFQLSCGWEIAFPGEWKHEIRKEDGEEMFYPPDHEDLTVRVMVFHAEKEGVLAPAEIMESAFVHTMPIGAVPKELSGFAPEGFSAKGCEAIQKKNGEKVYQFCVGCYLEGELLIYNTFCTDKKEGEGALMYLETLRRTALASGR